MTYRHPAPDHSVPRAAYEALRATLDARDAELDVLRTAQRRSSVAKVAVLLVTTMPILYPLAWCAAYGTPRRSASDVRVENATREARAYFRATDGRDVRAVRCGAPACGARGLRCAVTAQGDTFPQDLCCDTRDAVVNDGCEPVLDPPFE